uniref:Inositol 1,4,5-triphosphate receptor associated 2 n=1 Tax=Mus musculus TaxID=10090 RepID=D6RIN0_MOUSE
MLCVKGPPEQEPEDGALDVTRGCHNFSLEEIGTLFLLGAHSPRKAPSWDRSF